MSVVADAEQRFAVGKLGQQGQRRQPSEKAVRNRGVGESERGAQRAGLRPRQHIEAPQRWPQQQMQSRERQLGFRLNAGAPQHLHPLSRVDRVLKQRGLASARIAADNQHAAAPASCPLEEQADLGQLIVPSVKHDSHDNPVDSRRY